MVSIEQMKSKISSLKALIKIKEKCINELEFQVEDLKSKIDPINDAERQHYFSQIDHLQNSLIEQSRVIDMYQTWFKKNQYWTQIHNSIMQYNPHIGQYMLEGGDVEIVIPEVEQWEVVKNIPKLSTVAEDENEE